MRLLCRHNVRWLFGLILIQLVCFPFAARAGNTWDGGGANDNFNTANNWNGNGVPASNTALNFNGATRTSPSLNVSFTAASVTFSNTASTGFTIGAGGGTLTINGGGITNRSTGNHTINAPISLGASQTWTTTGTGTLTVGGTVDLNATTLTLSNTSSTGAITITGVTSDTGSIIKTGTGTARLSGTTANTYSGTTTVQDGILELSKTAGVDAIAGNITLGNGSGSAGTAELKLLAANQIADAATVTLVTPDGYFNLNGFSETVASVSGTGSIQLGANAILTVNHTTSVSFTGVIGGSGTAGLVKNGSGTWTLAGSAANTYTGATTVNEGQLTLSKSSGNAVSGSTLNIGDGAGTSAVVQLTAGNQIADSATITLLSDGRLDLNGQSDTVGIISITAGAGHDAISIGAGTLTMNGDWTINSSAEIAKITGSGSLALGSTERRLNVVGGASFPNPDLQIEAPISGSVGLTKNGSGSLYLVAASPSFSGPYTNNAGLVGIATSTSLGTGTVYMNGGGLVAGVVGLTPANNVTVGGDFGIGGYDLTMSGTVALGSATRTITVTNVNTTFSGVVSGTGGLTKVGTGTLILSGGSANTYSGATTVNAGELDLGKSSGLAIAGTANVTVGTGSGAGATLKLLASQQINDSAPLIVNADGTFNLNGFNETLGIITLNGGSIVGSGTLTMGGDLSTTVATNAVISATTLDLNGSTRVFNVGGTSLSIASVIQNGGVTKSGSGTLILSAANTFTGPLTISAGTVQLTTSDRIDNNVDVTIASGATFDLNGQNESIRALTMAGGVVQGSPSTLTLGGDVRYNGTTTTATIGTSFLSLGSSSPRTFNVDNGSAAIDMDVTSAVSGSVQLVKSGDGAIRFSNSANNWTLGTALNAGKIVMADKGALGTGALTMASGTTLELTYTDAANADLAGITMNGTSTILRTASAGAKSGLLNSGTLTVNGTATLTDQGGDAGVDSALIVDGPVVINNGGKLILNASGASDEVRLGGSSSITIAGGGELQTTGSGTTWLGKGSARNIIAQGSGSGANAGAFSEAKLTMGAGTSYHAGTTIQMNGSGQAGLMVTGSPTDVNTFLSGRIPTAGSGTITVVHTGSATNTFALQPASGSALMLGFGRANATDTPGYTLNSAIPNWAGLVIKGGTTRASVDQSFVGAGSSSFYIYDDIYGADAAARKANSVLTFLGNRTLSFNGNGYFYGGTINGNTGGGNQGTLVFTGSIVSEGTTLAGYPNITMNNATPQSVSGSVPLTGVGTFIKTGAGTLTLSVGITTVAGGGGIQIQQGSLVLGADNVINDTGSSMQLSTGVTFNSNGKLATLGTLSLSGQATVDLGSGTSVLHFQNTSAITWGTGTGLTINNWTGAAGGGGTDQLYFGSGSSGLTSGQLSKIVFVNPAGFAAGLYSAKILPTGEVVPLAIIPEPTTMATMGLLGLALAWRERQRWLRRRAAVAPAQSAG